MAIIHSGLVHLISQLLQITSAWWLASMFPLWMQIKLSHTILKPHFKGRTFLHQDRTGCPSSLQLCNAGTLPLPEKMQNKLFSLQLDWNIFIPYFRAIFPVLRTFFLPWQVCVLWSVRGAPSLLGCNKGKVGLWSLRALQPWAGAWWGTLCSSAFSLLWVGWLPGCSQLWWGKRAAKGFYFIPGGSVLCCSCRASAPPQEAQPGAALAQHQGKWEQMIAFANSNFQHSPKQANNLFYFHLQGG